MTTPTPPYLWAKIDLCGELALEQIREGKREEAIKNIDRMIHSLKLVMKLEEEGKNG